VELGEAESSGVGVGSDSPPESLRVIEGGGGFAAMGFPVRELFPPVRFQSLFIEANRRTPAGELVVESSLVVVVAALGLAAEEELSPGEALGAELGLSAAPTDPLDRAKKWGEE